MARSWGPKPSRAGSWAPGPEKGSAQRNRCTHNSSLLSHLRSSNSHHWALRPPKTVCKPDNSRSTRLRHRRRFCCGNREAPRPVLAFTPSHVASTPAGGGAHFSPKFPSAASSNHSFIHQLLTEGAYRHFITGQVCGGEQYAYSCLWDV